MSNLHPPPKFSGSALVPEEDIILLFKFALMTWTTSTESKIAAILVFPPRKSRREISRKIWGFEISRFPGNLCRDPGKFFFHFEGFSGNVIYHSDVKMRSCKVKNFFLFVKNYFSKFPKFFPTKCLGDQKIFPGICSKMRKTRTQFVTTTLKNA